MRLNLEAKCYRSGANILSYRQAVRKSLPAFIAGRLIPTAGISIVFLLMAHKAPNDLAVFSYVLAVVTMVSAPSSLLLATIGNKTASLAHNTTAQRRLFTGGFTMALGIAILTPLICLLTVYFASRASGAQLQDKEAFWNLSIIYISSTPLVVVNSFLQLFLEATGKAAHYSRLKGFITCGSGVTLTLVALSAVSESFKYYAMSYFFITEGLTLCLLIRCLSDQRLYSLVQAKAVSGYFLGTGAPIAAGLGGQKVFYYLLTERIARIDTSVVAQLSVFMTVIGLLIIPPLALCQIHSLQVSRNPQYAPGYYWRGLGMTIGIIGLVAVILLPVGEWLFQAVGGTVLPYDVKLYLLTVFFLSGSTLISFALGHLRARNDILVPQLFINTMMLVIFIPIVYSVNFTDPTLTTFLSLQGSMTWICFFSLWVRIFLMHKTDRKRDQSFFSEID